MAARTIQTDIKLMGEKEFNDAMKAMNSNMKVLRAEMRAVSSAFDEGGDATGNLNEKLRVLNEQVEQQEAIVSALEAQYRKTAASLGENSAAADKAKTAYLNAQAKLNDLKRDAAAAAKALEEESKAQEKSGNEAQDSAPKQERSAKALDKVAAAARTLGKALGGVAKSAFASGLDLIGKAAGGAVQGVKLLSVASLAAGASMTALAAGGLKKLIDFSLEAASSSGSFWKLRNAIGGLEDESTKAKQALGKIMLPALESFSKNGAKLLREFNKEMDKAKGDTSEMGTVIARYVRRGAELLRDELPAFVAIGTELFSGLAEGMAEDPDALAETLGEVIETVATGLEDNAELLGEAGASLVGTIGQLLVENAPALMEAGAVLIRSLLENVDAEELGESAGQLVADLVLLLIELAPDLAEAGLAFVGGLINGIAEAWPEITEEFRTSVNGVIAVAKRWWIQWKGAGAEWMKGLWAGLKEWWGKIVDWWNGVKDALTLSGDFAYTGSMGSTGGNSVGNRPGLATGINYVPYDEYPALLHEGEMVAPKGLATQLRRAGINRNTQSLDSLAAFNRPAATAAAPVVVEHRTSIEFGGDLAQLGRVLQPVIKEESTRRGAAFVT